MYQARLLGCALANCMIVLQELPRGSTQATEYTVQLLAILDAAVQAASTGTHVLAVLEVRKPC